MLEDLDVDVDRASGIKLEHDDGLEGVLNRLSQIGKSFIGSTQFLTIDRTEWSGGDMDRDRSVGSRSIRGSVSR